MPFDIDYFRRDFLKRLTAAIGGFLNPPLGNAQVATDGQGLEYIKHTLTDLRAVSASSGEYGLVRTDGSGNSEAIYRYDGFSWNFTGISLLNADQVDSPNGVVGLDSGQQATVLGGLDTRGDVVEDTDTLYRTSDKVFEKPAAGQNNTVVVTGDPSTRSTRATAVDNAIGKAGTDGKDFVLVPSEFGPGTDGYDTGAANFKNNGFSGQLLREGNVRDVYDIKAYGAAVDGSTDDSPAIQAALNAGAGNAPVEHTSGTSVASDLSVSSNCDIRGQGTFKLPDATLTNNNKDEPIFKLAAVTNVSIEGITFDGNKSNQSYYDTGMRWEHGSVRITGDGTNESSQIRIRKCTFREGKTNGVLAITSNNINVIDNSFLGAEIHGTAYVGCQNVQHKDNYHEEDGLPDTVTIATDSSDRCGVIGRRSGGRSFPGETTDRRNQQIDVHNNHFLDCNAEGPALFSTLNSSINDNVIRDIGKERDGGGFAAGIWVEDFQGQISGNVIHLSRTSNGTDLQCDGIRAFSVRNDLSEFSDVSDTRIEVLGNTIRGGFSSGNPTNSLRIGVVSWFRVSIKNNKIQSGNNYAVQSVAEASNSTQKNIEIIGNQIKEIDNEAIIKVEDGNNAVSTVCNVKIRSNNIVSCQYSGGNNTSVIVDFDYSSDVILEHVSVVGNELEGGGNFTRGIRFLSGATGNTGVEELDLSHNAIHYVTNIAVDFATNAIPDNSSISQNTIQVTNANDGLRFSESIGQHNRIIGNGIVGPTRCINIGDTVTGDGPKIAYNLLQGGNGVVLASSAAVNRPEVHGNTYDGGGALSQLGRTIATLDFESINAQTSAEQTVTVNGAETDMGATVSPQGGTLETDIVLTAYVSAADTVTVKATNITSGAVDPSSRDYLVKVHT
jgi:hypothetical protein